MPTKTIRVEVSHLEALQATQNFPSQSPKQGGIESVYDLAYAVDTALTFYLETRKYSLARLKGHFTREELTAIIASLNGTMFDYQFATDAYTFLMHLEDAVNLDRIDLMYGCDKQQLFKKCEELSDIQILVIQHEIALFWESGRDLEEFLSTL